MSRDFILLLIGGGLFLLIAMVGLLLQSDGSGKKAAKRLQKVRERHSQSQAVKAEAEMRKILAARETKLDTMFSGFLPRKDALQKRLKRTGKSWGVGQYAVATLVLIAVPSVALMAAGVPKMMAAGLGLLFGLAIPHMVVGFLIGKRLKDFQTRFPDAIDLLVRGLRSGLPVGESINVVGQEIPGVVGEEFRGVSDKIRIGRTMEQALQETADRLGTAEFQFFVITLSIQRETGGNLAETLNNLGEVLRSRQQMKLKIKAMSSESKASAYIVGSLPFIVSGLIYMVDPGYMSGFGTDSRLMVAGVGGLIWMSIGAFIMAKMVSFEI